MRGDAGLLAIAPERGADEPGIKNLVARSWVRGVADHIAVQRSRNGVRRCNRYDPRQPDNPHRVPGRPLALLLQESERYGARRFHGQTLSGSDEEHRRATRGALA